MSGGNSTRAWAGGPRDSEHIFLTKIDIHRVINIRSQKFFRCMDSPNPSTDRGRHPTTPNNHARASGREEGAQAAGRLARSPKHRASSSTFARVEVTRGAKAKPITRLPSEENRNPEKDGGDVGRGGWIEQGGSEVESGEELQLLK